MTAEVERLRAALEHDGRDAEWIVDQIAAGRVGNAQQTALIISERTRRALADNTRGGA